MNEHPLAVITGGSRGLGRNTAEALARRGVDSIITFRSNEAEARQVVAAVERAGARAVALQLDVAQAHTFSDFAATLRRTLETTFQRDRFDALVNNAGTGLHKPFADITEAEFDELMNVHLKGTFFLTQRLLPLLKDGGRIVNVSTGLARFTLPGYSAYAAMKGGVEVLTRYLAKELGPRGIAVNVVAPGAIATDFNGGAVRDNPQVNAFIASATALGRAGLPDDIGPVISNLLREENRWITGQRLEVSGGMNL
ncbi:MAG: SDR family NAD(P)-dependent oxidoreductase [Myxococcota bacterium]